VYRPNGILADYKFLYILYHIKYAKALVQISGCRCKCKI